MNNLISIALLVGASALLSACGSSDINSGQLTFAISDNPSEVKEAVIAFKSVAIKRVYNSQEVEENNTEQHIAVQDKNGENSDYRQIDLKQYQGSDAAELFTDIPLEPGDYQMCIYISNGSGTQDADDSYVVDEDGRIKGLRTPSNGSCAGFKPDDQLDTGRLKTATFTINEGKNYLVAEFDLMKVLKQPVGNKDYWTLKPTGYQLIQAENAGSIEGLVAEEVINNINCIDGISMAYLYPETVTLENMGDFRGDIAQEVGITAPLASAPVDPIEHAYEFGFVIAGNYSIGYTCTDDQEIAQTRVIAAALQDIIVSAEQTTAATPLTETVDN